MDMYEKLQWIGKKGYDGVWCDETSELTSW